jgi:hypothetical protein
LHPFKDCSLDLTSYDENNKKQIYKNQDKIVAINISHQNVVIYQKKGSVLKMDAAGFLKILVLLYQAT